MTKLLQLRELTHDIKNPMFDGRAKGGVRAVHTFKTGTRFGFAPARIEEHEPGIVYFSFGGGSMDYDFVELIESLSAPAVARNWTEFKLTHNYFATNADMVLAAMVQQGFVKLEDVRSIVETITEYNDKQWDALQ